MVPLLFVALRRRAVKQQEGAPGPLLEQPQTPPAEAELLHGRAPGGGRAPLFRIALHGAVGRTRGARLAAAPGGVVAST